VRLCSRSAGLRGRRGGGERVELSAALERSDEQGRLTDGQQSGCIAAAYGQAPAQTADAPLLLLPLHRLSRRARSASSRAASSMSRSTRRRQRSVKSVRAFRCVFPPALHDVTTPSLTLFRLLARSQVAPNFCRVLSHFGVLDRLTPQAVRLGGASVRRYVNNEQLNSTSFANLEPDYGWPAFVVHRGDLHKALLDRALELGAQLKVGVRPTSSSPPDTIRRDDEDEDARLTPTRSLAVADRGRQLRAWQGQGQGPTRGAARRHHRRRRHQVGHPEQDDGAARRGRRDDPDGRGGVPCVLHLLSPLGAFPTSEC